MIPWLTYISPSVAALSSIMWLWCLAGIGKMLEERKIRAIYTKYKTHCSAAMQDPNTSEDHKKKLVARLEEMEETIFERQISEIRSLSGSAGPRQKSLSSI
jgi:hypothetical protein